MTDIRVLIADDQHLLRASFAVLIGATPGLEVVGEAGDGLQAVELATTLRPDVVLMDIRMPGLDGIEATKRICGDPATEGVKVLILTTYDLDAYIFSALRAGASGFLLKDTPPAELLRAVRVAAEGDAMLSPSVARRLIETFAAAPPAPSFSRLPELTEREADVLRLVAQGLSNAGIAQRLHIGAATVKTYISRLLTKLDAETRVHLVIRAYESGLVSPGRA